MNIYLSYSMVDKDKAEAICSQLQEANISTMTISSVPIGENVISALENMIRNADALVFLVGANSSRDNRLQREWSTALEQSWSMPGKQMIPILIGNAEFPPFLQGRAAISIPGDFNCEQASAQLIELLTGENFIQQTQQDKKNDEWRTQQKHRYNQILQDASCFEMSEDDFQGQFIWLLEQEKKLKSQNPDSFNLASLQIRLADFMKKRGNERDNDKIIEYLKSAIGILQKNKDGSKRLQARAQTNLATVLMGQGNLQEALVHWKAALDLYQKESPDSLILTEMHNALKELLNKMGKSDTRWQAMYGVFEDITRKAKDMFPSFSQFFGKSGSPPSDNVNKNNGTGE